MTKKTFKFNNVTVGFSTMLNKPEKAKYGRNFKIRVPMDSPELARLQESYKELNDKAKAKLSEEVGKRLKNADMQIFDESPMAEGFVELGFNVYFMREREVTLEDGTKEKQTVEVLNPIYKAEDFCYRVDNNGQKTYETPNGTKWRPLSQNILNVELSMVARYDTKNNRPKIEFKAENVEIVESQYGGKSNGPKTSILTLDDDDDEVEVAEKKPVKQAEMFDESDLASLDI